MKLVIIGGVAGGASAAARARRLSEDAEILILERGDYVSFANCGLPYHIGGDIRKRSDLLISTPERFMENYNIEVRTGHEVMAIDRQGRKVRVADLKSGEQYEESYDRLILSQGSAAVRPEIPGMDHPRVFTLRDIPDMDAIKAVVDGRGAVAVVVGAGYIGLETAEALALKGMKVHLVELKDQVLPILDPEMASDLEQQLIKQGIRLHLGASVTGFRDAQGRLETEISGAGPVIADLAVIAVGVRPETGLAVDAGLEIGESGGVQVDRHMLTSDPHIYAVGDMIEVRDTVTGEPVNIPLAGPANRQGRTAADNIFGRESGYSTTQGTAIVKVFEMTAAITGASEKTLKRLGHDYEKIHIWPYGHALYYPGTSPMHLKLLFDKLDGAILGAQIVGRDGVDKRIDVLAVAVRAGMNVYDLEHLELAYAPPYGSAKDAVNMAGFVGTNVLNGDIRFWFAQEYPQIAGTGTILDVRTRREYAAGHIKGAVNIPIEQSRQRLEEIERLPQPIYIYCLTGIRSYYVYRILHHHGYTDIHNLAGGYRTFESCFREMNEDGTFSILHTEN